MVKVKKKKKTLDVRVNQRQSEGGDLLRISVGKITVHREFTSLWSCKIARRCVSAHLSIHFFPSLIKRAAREMHQKSGAFFPS